MIICVYLNLIDSTGRCADEIISIHNDTNTFTILDVAVLDSDTKTTQNLIDAGADANVPNYYGQTPLMYNSAIAEDSDIAKILIKAGANINAQDVEGNTALMYAVRGDHAPLLIKELISAGTDLSIKNKKGDTALDVASRCSQKRVLTLRKAIKAHEEEQEQKAKAKKNKRNWLWP